MIPILSSSLLTRSKYIPNKAYIALRNYPIYDPSVISSIPKPKSFLRYNSSLSQPTSTKNIRTYVLSTIPLKNIHNQKLIASLSISKTLITKPKLRNPSVLSLYPYISLFSIPSRCFSSSSLFSTTTRSFASPLYRYHSTASTSVSNISKTNDEEEQLKQQQLYKDQNNTWVDRYAPIYLIPYLKLTRIDRPIGTWLVLLPGWWGLSWCLLPSSLSTTTATTTAITTATSISSLSPFLSLIPIDLYLYFGIGAFLMRSAGCTVNDIWDRHYDKAVARTRLRPLASNQISLWKAILFLLFQLLLGFYILLQLNTLTLYIGILAVPIVSLYPLMKRFTYFPQAVLGIAMSYGIWMGYCSMLNRTESTWLQLQKYYYQEYQKTNIFDISIIRKYLVPNYNIYFPSLSSSSSSSTISSTQLLVPWSSLKESVQVLLPFYLGSICWTIVYDTIYAYQDIIDDKRLGLKSTAIYMGNRGKFILTTLSIFGVAGNWYLAGYMDQHMGSVYYTAVTVSLLHLLYQCQTMDFNDRINLTKRFTSNRYIGWIMLCGILGGRAQTYMQE